MEQKCPDESLRMRRMNLNLRILRMVEDTFSAWRGPVTNWYESSKLYIYVLCFGYSTGSTSK